MGLVPSLLCPSQDTEDLDHYEMKEEEPADGRKTEDEGIGKENLAILEKIKKNQRQDYLNVRASQGAGGLGKQRGQLWPRVQPGSWGWLRVMQRSWRSAARLKEAFLQQGLGMPCAPRSWASPLAVAKGAGLCFMLLLQLHCVSEALV